MIVAYAQPAKRKSVAVCEAFAQGAGGVVNLNVPPVLEPGAAAFWGVVGLEHLLRLAIAEGRDWFYGDNSFFDAGRGKLYRFSKNTVQAGTLLPPDHDKLKALGVQIEPWRKDGRHIVVVEQSEHFLKLMGQDYWLPRVLRELSRFTERPVRVRQWSRDKVKAARGLREDLKDAWALVTHMSAAANEALLAGVPVFVSGLCAATPLASGELSRIETPTYPDGREDWAAGLAGAQWTLDELKRGEAWRVLEAENRVVKIQAAAHEGVAPESRSSAQA